MTASFPASVKSFDAIVDGVTEIEATNINQAYEEIVSLETIASQSMLYADFSNTETLTTTKTLADTDMPLQFLDPGGAARTVALPAEAATNHAFLIANQADADELITVTDDAAAVIGYVYRYENKLFVSNGTAWSFVGGLELHKVRTTAQFNKTSDGTLANVTGLSVNVKAGRTYAFKAVLFTTSNTSGGVKAAINGTATATAIVYTGVCFAATSLVHSRVTSLGSTVGALTSVATGTIIIDGTITVNAAGTLTVQFAQNASNENPSSVLVGSTFIVEEIS